MHRAEYPPYLYQGNLLPHEPQYKSGQFLGIALEARHPREISHDLTRELPFPSDTFVGAQSQDVLEHLPYARVPFVLNELFRVLKEGSVFRLSVPDYRSPLLRRRCVYDANGSILIDTLMGGKVAYDAETGCATAQFGGDGNAHLWFPKFELLLELILATNWRHASRIDFLHCFTSDTDYIISPIDQNVMPVARIPPHDIRANGAPISIVIDFKK